jgi:hypothetical protein
MEESVYAGSSLEKGSGIVENDAFAKAASPLLQK